MSFIVYLQINVSTYTSLHPLLQQIWDLCQEVQAWGRVAESCWAEKDLRMLIDSS